MTFYEELGITPRASAEEVRKSYKRLALLFHPDRHQDPEIRALAEVQMKRLNEMLAILTDSKQRESYDQSLRTDTRFVRHVHWHEWNSMIRSSPAWVLTGALLITFAASVALIQAVHPTMGSGATRRWPEATASHAEAVSHSQPQPTALGAPRPRGFEHRAAGRNREAASKLLPKPTEQPATPIVAGPEPPTAASSGQAAVSSSEKTTTHVVSPPSSARPSGRESVAPPSLAGRWVYTPDPKDHQDPNLYPADYVELSIEVTRGTLLGVYHSRYKISNRATSPYVDFTFEGQASETSFAWSGGSGAKGEVTLRLESPDLLKINWFATEMGSTLSLGSGTATLYRFR